jgi:hypothetical protein
LPEKTNSGALMGTVCHALFECLGNPRHKHHYEKIIKEKSIDASKASARLLKYGLEKVGILDEESLNLVKAMCLNGLNYDFYGDVYVNAYGSANVESSEEPFDYSKESDGKRYRIKGFIDKLWLFKNKTCALIRDFKSSKKMYADKEFEENMQNLMYVLAVKHLYPDVVKQRVEFLFLRFDLKNGEGVMRGRDLSDEELEGFEYFLTEVQKVVDNFDENLGLSDMAKKKPYATDGSFSGPLMCGRAKYPGDVKKDGGPQYYCPFKFGFDYYVLRDIKSGKILASSFEEEICKLFDIQKDGQEILKKTYGGCPAWKR